MMTEIATVKHALENEEVAPFFQPLVDFRTGQLCGFEVLARWLHPTEGYILPSNFISLAEECGLIGSLTHQILGKAFRLASTLPESLTIAVNISPMQLHYTTLPTQIQHLAQESSFALNRLTIEITESALFGDIDQVKSVVKELKALGCRLALDDFGTGYSSLNHLQILPFDELKIDRSFVASMTKTRESRKIVASIAGLGHSLGLTTIAEGVETEEQAHLLLWLGCDVGQGWLYGRPAPEAELASVLSAPRHTIQSQFSTPGGDWAVSSLEALPTHRLAQLQAIYDGAPVGLCFLDRRFNYVSINQRLAEMNGAPVLAHLGHSVETMHPDLFPRIEPYLLRALAGEAIADIEISMPLSGSEQPEKTLLLSYQPAWDESDEVIGISVAVVDITARKRTEDALIESISQSESVEKQRHQTAWSMDPQGGNLKTSAQWVPTAGVSGMQVRNLGWLEALNPEDLEGSMKTMAIAIRTGKPIDMEYRIMGIDGDWKWVRSQGFPRFGPSGEIVRWCGTIQDIDRSQRKEPMKA
jgi:PAS domain S-box-containing protein